MRNRLQVCPYLDLADDRCAGRFTMRKLGEAFRYCIGSPRDCPIYAQLVADGRPAEMTDDPALAKAN